MSWCLRRCVHVSSFVEAYDAAKALLDGGLAGGEGVKIILGGTFLTGGGLNWQLHDLLTKTLVAEVREGYAMTSRLNMLAGEFALILSRSSDGGAPALAAF